MQFLRTTSVTIIVIYLVAVLILFLMQKRLIFYPGRLNSDYRFKLNSHVTELFLKTADGEAINALFFRRSSPDVILYFHGNAGDLSGWQYVAEDFARLPYSFMIIDYRGYGKSTGTITEKGLYEDAQAAFDHLISKGYSPNNILIYGRSIGSGVAVDLAYKNKCKGLILESPFSSLSILANEKFPFFFPSLYLRYRFNNVRKIETIRCPVVLLHGSDDTLIPASHSRKLFKKCSSKKKLVIVDNGAHNDLHAFAQYATFFRDELQPFFNDD